MTSEEVIKELERSIQNCKEAYELFPIEAFPPLIQASRRQERDRIIERYEYAIAAVKCRPTADNRPIGKWEWDGHSSSCMCTKCHMWQMDESDFCPNCGADMRGVE